MHDTIDLDVNTISELKDKGIPATDDSPKYKYHALPSEDQQTMYSKFTINFVELRRKFNFDAIRKL